MISNKALSLFPYKEILKKKFVFINNINKNLTTAFPLHQSNLPYCAIKPKIVVSKRPTSSQIVDRLEF